MLSFNEKNIVLTGAATGIGRLMALGLAQEKAVLALVDINELNLEQTLEEVKSLGITARAYVCDISKKADIEKTMGAIKADFGHIDILINNAGIVTGKYVHEMEYDDISRTLDVNFIGGAYLTRLALPDMMKRNQGFIASIASAMGLTGVPRMADYCASKHAIIGFNDSLRMELKKFKYDGVKTLVVCPSAIDTGMFAGYKALFFSPLLKPETVAEKTLEAIKKERTYLKLPFIVKLIPSMKLFPATIQDILGRFTGLEKSMDHFQGKSSQTTILPFIKAK
jgi:all-trans-retinol dehydrogenase (NAD+)